MTKYDFYWNSNPAWWQYDKEMRTIFHEDAPQEAQESYRHYLFQRRRHSLKDFQNHTILLTDIAGILHLGQCIISFDEQEQKCFLSIADRTFEASEIILF